MSDGPPNIVIHIKIEIPPSSLAHISTDLEAILSRLSKVGQPIDTEEPSLSRSETERTETDRTETDRTETERRELDANIRRFDRLTVQIYRQFRRIEADYDRPYDAFKELGKRHDLSPSIIQYQVGRRKKVVRSYLDRRRLATASRMARDGATNQQIADALHVSQPTANRIIKKAKEHIRGTSNA